MLATSEGEHISVQFYPNMLMSRHTKMTFCCQIQGDIKTTREITIPPLGTVHIKGMTKERCQSKRVHVMTQAPAKCYSEQVMTTSTYTELRPDSSKVTICVRNLSAKPMTIPAKTSIESVSTANIIPPMLAPKLKAVKENHEEETDANKAKLSEEKQDKSFQIRLIWFR